MESTLTPIRSLTAFPLLVLASEVGIGPQFLPNVYHRDSSGGHVTWQRNTLFHVEQPHAELDACSTWNMSSISTESTAHHRLAQLSGVESPLRVR